MTCRSSQLGWRLQRRQAGAGRRVFAPAGGAHALAAPGASAFTLVEMILALALLVLLLAVGIVSFQGTLEETRGRESVNRLSALLRSCRAEAGLTGRRLRLTFDEGTGNPLVTIEQDPLGAPGTFQPYEPWWVTESQLSGAARVNACELTGGDVGADATMASTPGAPDASQSALGTVTFYPDGSSDSARIVVVSDDPDRPWATEITLNGMDGTVSVSELDTGEQSG